MKKSFLGVVVIVVGVLLGIFLFSPNSAMRTPKRGDVIESVYGLATVASDKIYHLKFGISTRIDQIHVREGEFVKAGTKLIQTSDRQIMAAPFDGTVTAVNIHLGELASSQMAALTLIDLSKLYLELSLEQQALMHVKVGHAVHASFESLRDQIFDGVVSSIYPREQELIVRVDLKTIPPTLLPGMTADLAIDVAHKRGALLIPLKSVKSGKVIRVRSGERSAITVQTGVVENEWVELVSGDVLETDQLVVDD